MRNVMVLVVCVAACSKSDSGTSSSKKSAESDSAPREVAIAELGVAVTAPGDWKVYPFTDGVGRIASRMDGVVLQRMDSAPASVAEAGTRLPETAKLVESKALPSGAFEVTYQIAGALPTTQVILQLGKGAIVCDAQLPPTDRAAATRACESMHAVK